MPICNQRISTALSLPGPNFESPGMKDEGAEANAG